MKFIEYSCVCVLLSVIKGEVENPALEKPANQSSQLVDNDIGISRCYKKGKGRNVTLNKPAYQSILFNDINGRANKLVDGSCSHTLEVINSWLEVDLKSTYGINKVIVYNRELVEYRSSNDTLSRGVNCNSTSKYYTECYHHQTSDLVNHRVNNCTARYIKITNVLHHSRTFCEVQIFTDQVKDIKGEVENLGLVKPANKASLFVDHDIGITKCYKKGEGRNVPLDKPVYHSNLYFNHDNGRPNKVVDGCCSHTLEVINSWLEVDLKSTYGINKVIVYNRELVEYRSDNGLLSRGVHCNSTSKYTECYHHQTSDLVNNLITNCTARYIKITNVLDYGRTFCEVQIFTDQGKGVRYPNASLVSESSTASISEAPGDVVPDSTAAKSIEDISSRCAIFVALLYFLVD